VALEAGPSYYLVRCCKILSSGVFFFHAPDRHPPKQRIQYVHTRKAFRKPACLLAIPLAAFTNPDRAIAAIKARLAQSGFRGGVE